MKQIILADHNGNDLVRGETSADLDDTWVVERNKRFYRYLRMIGEAYVYIEVRQPYTITEF